MEYFLAIDIGASSGRHILTRMDDGKLFVEEIYRFKNSIIEKNNHLYWDVDHLFSEIIQGMKKAKLIDKIPVSVGIDTWGVDYVLLDKKNQRMSDVSCYRDSRTEKFQNLSINKKDLFKITGLQHQPFNTLYQLNSEQEIIKNEQFEFLMIPDYFHFLLSGVKVNEYTNMSTTQLLNINTMKLETSLLDEIHISNKVFQNMVMPSIKIGNLKQSIVEEIGYDCEVIVPATHDTGSSFMASIIDNEIILSSGTWSLLGVELNVANQSEMAYENNFTNEGGYQGKIRFLKNIMGLWLIQEVARELKFAYSFEELANLAKDSQFKGFFDANDQRFMSPKNMILEIQEYFRERNEVFPETVSDIAFCVYHSLAVAYKNAIEIIEQTTNKKYKYINVIGGGCKNQLLNQLIQDVCQKQVIVGPVESTAIGNSVAQMIGYGKLKNIEEAKSIIKRSFEIKE